MINSVRNTVLSVINKNNYGYISPSDFNLFAKQAQLDIFEDYFYKINYQVNKENARQSGTGLSDIRKQYDEVVSTFSSTAALVNAGTNSYTLPADYYLLNVVQYNTTGSEIEKIAESKIRNLTASTLMAPTTAFPLYVHRGNAIDVYPTTIIGASDVDAFYIRHPLDPKWTYFTLADGAPVFDETAADYQDFELPMSDEPILVAKILEYAGISIREGDVYTFGNTEEQQETVSEK
mgnify:CR=1 FL=1|jgi:hypothetical protein